MVLTLEEVVVLATIHGGTSTQSVVRADALLKSTKFSVVAAHTVLVDLRARGMVEQEAGRQYLTRRGLAALRGAKPALERVLSALGVQLGDL